MLEFRSPTLDDKGWVNSLLASSGERGCEYTFGNIFIWQDIYGDKIARFGDYFIAVNDKVERYFSFPVGSGDLKKAIEAMFEYSRANSWKDFKIFGLTKTEVTELEAAMPGRFSFTADRDAFDYVYSVEKLAKLSGKKLHSKRNHISAFEKLYPDWKYEEITKDNIKQCAEMNTLWEQKNAQRGIEGLDDEKHAIEAAFENYFDLGFRGGLLRAGGEVVAYTLGEPILGSKTFCTHLEKAFADVRGAYPMINREFAANTISDFDFVNREEDLGQEGLRKAKLSYQPEFLLEKFEAKLNE